MQKFIFLSRKAEQSCGGLLGFMEVACARGPKMPVLCISLSFTAALCHPLATGAPRSVLPLWFSPTSVAWRDRGPGGAGFASQGTTDWRVTYFAVARVPSSVYCCLVISTDTQMMTTISHGWGNPPPSSSSILGGLPYSLLIVSKSGAIA